MAIYGVGLLALCYLIGQLLGDFIGNILGINANVGGVGFSMLLLIIFSSYLQKKNLLNGPSEEGIKFWSNLYIPIIVAMAATQNVKLAFSSGLVSLMAGLIPVMICFFCIPLISKLSKWKS